MVVFPNCKINLGLHITSKRTDGFHNLETIFFPVAIHYCLEIIYANKTESTHFSQTGLNIDTTSDNNLCVKAYHLLKKDFPLLPSIQIHLHKTIPMGAGLGGGSADGAFALKLMNDQFHLHLSDDELIHYALQLGSDCPFFIINKPCFASSRGEILTPITLTGLTAYQLLIVNPGIHISTAWAFANIKPKQPLQSLKEVIQQPVDTWKQLLFNDFEVPVLQQFPELKQLKEVLYQSGAAYVSMSGSGSTFFAFFKNNIPENLSLPAHYFIKMVTPL